MAGSLNKVMLIGHLGNDPKKHDTQSGKMICNLSLATSESWTDKQSGEKREKTEWHTVAIFNDNIARIAYDYLKKGSKVYVEGQLQTEKWQDKDGADRYTTKVILQGFAAKLVLLDGRETRSSGGKVDSTSPNDGRDSGRSSAGGSGRPSNADMDDDIPFCAEFR